MADEAYRRTYYVQPSDVMCTTETEVRSAVTGKLDEQYVEGWIAAARVAGDTALLRGLLKMVPAEPRKPLKPYVYKPHGPSAGGELEE